MPTISVPWDHSLTYKPLYPVQDFAGGCLPITVSSVTTSSGRTLFAYPAQISPFNTGGYDSSKYYIFTSYADSLSDVVGDSAPSNGGSNGRTSVLTFPTELTPKVTGNPLSGTGFNPPPSVRLFRDGSETYMLITGFEPEYNVNFYGTFILRDSSSAKNGSGPWVYHSTVASGTITDSVAQIATSSGILGGLGGIAVLDNGDWVTIANTNYRTPLPGPITLSVPGGEALQAVVADVSILRSTNKGASWSVVYTAPLSDGVVYNFNYYPDWPDIETSETLPQPDPTTLWYTGFWLGEQQTSTGELVCITTSEYRYRRDDTPSPGQTTYGAGSARGQLVSVNNGASWGFRETPYIAESPLNVQPTDPFSNPEDDLAVSLREADHMRWYWVPFLTDSVGDWVFEVGFFGGFGFIFGRRSSNGPYAQSATTIPHAVYQYGSPTNLGTASAPQLVGSSVATGAQSSALQHLMRTGDVVSGGWLTGAVGWR